MISYQEIFANSRFVTDLAISNDGMKNHTKKLCQYTQFFFNFAIMIIIRFKCKKKSENIIPIDILF